MSKKSKKSDERVYMPVEFPKKRKLTDTLSCSHGYLQPDFLYTSRVFFCHVFDDGSIEVTVSTKLRFRNKPFSPQRRSCWKERHHMYYPPLFIKPGIQLELF